MFARVSRAMTNVVGTLAMAVDNFVLAQAVLRTHLIPITAHLFDASEQHKEGGLFQSRCQVRIVSAGLSNEFTQLNNSKCLRSHVVTSLLIDSKHRIKFVNQPDRRSDFRSSGLR